MFYSKRRGFTLIELLVVIAIIGILSSVVLVSLDQARERGRATAAVSQIREIKTAVIMYYNDVGQYPPDCRLNCTEATDPFLNNPGVSGWNGPYLSFYDFVNPWGGQYAYSARSGLWGDDYYAIVLDDDAPGTTTTNNSGAIPLKSLKTIDEMLDDGDLSTGLFYGDGAGGTAEREGVYAVEK